MKTGSSVAALACLLALGQMAWADVIVMKNGRQFQGIVLEDTAAYVKADVMVGGIRITASVTRAKVASIEKKPLPEGFFDAGAGKSTKPVKFPPGSTPYLEVPFVGRIGTDVVSPGIARCLNYAAGQQIRHVVFVVDSKGGDIDSAREIRKALEAQSKKLTYHCIVRNAIGEAMVIPAWSKTILLQDGASLGGVMLTADRTPLSRGQTLEILRSQIANEASARMEARGFPGDVVRAMVDPTFNLVAWTAKDKNVHLAEGLPEGVAKDHVIFSDTNDEQVLTLSDTQAAAIGFGRIFKGTSADVGKLLGLSKWTSAGDYGARAMREAAAVEAQRKKKEAAEFESSMRRTIQRRETVQAYIEANMKDAEKYDPTKESKYQQQRSYEWGNNVIITAERVSNEFTDRASITIRALQRANSGIEQLIGLEKTAKKLDLTPLRSPDELANQQNSNNVRIKFLTAEARRRSHIIRE